MNRTLVVASELLSTMDLRSQSDKMKDESFLDVIEVVFYELK